MGLYYKSTFFFRLEKSGSANLDFFLGLQPEKNPSLQNHFSATLGAERLSARYLIEYISGSTNTYVYADVIHFKNGFNAP